jgi:cytochrome c-type biogenesis protein CcmH/NrfG
MNPDQLAELEEERRFLLRSLADLDRELEAGDVDPHDFEVLRDGYTARAASVLRAIDHGRAALPPKRARNPRAIVLGVVAVVAVAALSGWLLARSSGQRIEGQTITGGQAADDVPTLLVQARQQFVTGNLQASAESYGKVVQLDPTNSEARAYSAWLLVIDSQQKPAETAAAMVQAALSGFAQVTADDPTYADAHCLYAVAVHLFAPEPDEQLVQQQRQLCEQNDPPAEMTGLVDEQLGAAPASGPTTVAPATTAG